MSDTTNAVNVIQQISDDADKLHRFCHGGDAESVELGGTETPTVHSFLSQWVQFLRSVTTAGESFTPSLEAGYYLTTTGSASSSSYDSWLRSSNYCPVIGGRVYAVDFSNITSNSGDVPERIDIHFYNESKAWLSANANNIFFKAPETARYIRFCFKYSDTVSSGASPKISVTDVVSGTRSAGGLGGKHAVALNWKKGFVHYSEPVNPATNYLGSDDTRYALIFVSKGDLVWLKAAQSHRQSIISCINSSGQIVNKVANDGENRDYWFDHMWIADQDTCVILSNNVSFKSNPSCLVYPQFLYNNDVFNDAIITKNGFIRDSGFCSSYEETYDPNSETYVYASSQLICLKKGQYISFSSSVTSNTYAIGYYDNSDTMVLEKSVAGLSSDMSFYCYLCEDEFCFVRTCGRILEVNPDDNVDKFIEYKVYNPNELSGKTMAMIGDSYVGSGNRSSHARAACNLGMAYTSYGLGGNTVSAYQENGMVIRYAQMANGFDYVGFVGGRNDYNHGVPIGSLDSTDTSTFCGALNVLCEGLIKKYIGAKIFAMTSWNVNDEQNAYNDAFVAVVSGRWNIPVLQAYKGVNVYVKVAEFRQAFCLTGSDVSHLNILGHMNVMAPAVEAFIKTL